MMLYYGGMLNVSRMMISLTSIILSERNCAAESAKYAIRLIDRIVMKFLEIVDKAIRQNIDCDMNGEVDGFEFAAEQIIRDMRNVRYSIVTKHGKKLDYAAMLETLRRKKK